MKAQMLEHQRFLNEQYGLLRAADEAMSQQNQKIDVLAAAVQAPAPEVRWGLFAQPNQQHVGDVKTEPDQAVMVATGANMPTPPLYRGSTKKEKRAFMDSYLVYERRIRALNQGANAKVFTMPIGACIEHRTLMRICQFELFRSDTEISEAEWRHYFLSAKSADEIDYTRLTQAVRGLQIDVSLSDAESRLSRLMADFYAILDTNNMEDLLTEDPSAWSKC
ncbi:hypothetical protein PINS_up023761 [Pythium insidiosum]|nr:hypothetical protein PINS_up023761 [Pythium insidiosum]